MFSHSGISDTCDYQRKDWGLLGKRTDELVWVAGNTPMANSKQLESLS